MTIRRPTPECFNYKGFDLTVMSIEELKYFRSDQLDNAEIGADDYNWLADEIDARIDFLKQIQNLATIASCPCMYE
jgi:hypothetical protein